MTSERTQTPTWSAHDPDPPISFASGFVAHPDRSCHYEILSKLLNFESNPFSRSDYLNRFESIGRLSCPFGDDTRACKLDRWSIRMSPRRFHHISTKNRNVSEPHPNGPPTKAPTRHPYSRIGGPQIFDSSPSSFESILFDFIFFIDNFNPAPRPQDSRSSHFDARPRWDGSDSLCYDSMSNRYEASPNARVSRTFTSGLAPHHYGIQTLRNDSKSNCNEVEIFLNEEESRNYVSETFRGMTKPFRSDVPT